MNTVYYCLSNNPRANVPNPILNISTLVNEIVLLNYVVKRIYVSSEVSGTQSIAIGSLTNNELIVPFSANVKLLTDSKGCMYSPVLAYSMVNDTELYLTADADIDGVVNIMIEVDSVM
jgi:hypothetical protein